MPDGGRRRYRAHGRSLSRLTWMFPVSERRMDRSLSSAASVRNTIALDDIWHFGHVQRLSRFRRIQYLVLTNSIFYGDRSLIIIATEKHDALREEPWCSEPSMVIFLSQSLQLRVIELYHRFSVISYGSVVGNSISAAYTKLKTERNLWHLQ